MNLRKVSILPFLIPALLFAYPIYDEETPSQEVAKEEESPSVIKKMETQNQAKASADSLDFTFSKREPHKRSSLQGTGAARSKLRSRRNPNRPRVIHRDPQNKPHKQPSKIEADAQEDPSTYDRKDGKEVSEIPEDEVVKKSKE
jgi:hypothetical protein